MTEPSLIDFATSNSGLVGVAFTFFGIAAQMCFYMGMRYYQLKRLEEIEKSHNQLSQRVAHIEGRLEQF